MKLTSWLSAVLLTAAAQFSLPAFADGPTDSSANAAAGFLKDVQEARAVVLRVPINERGEENTSMASARIYKGDQDFRGAGIMTAWDQGTSIDDQPRLATDTPTDSSTWGWYNYRYNYGGYGNWANQYYYYNYQPYAYYYGNSYYYSNAYYYNNWYGGNYGYRYYYYCY